jgi:Amt family ammonium transporter
MQTFSGLAILSTLWFVLGFTLVFSPSQGGFIGGFDWLFYNNVPFNESLDYAPTIPGVTFATYQMMFAVITPLLITGAFAERVRWNAFVSSTILLHTGYGEEGGLQNWACSTLPAAL